MTPGLFDEPMEKKRAVRCIDCAKFAGQRRDHGAFLFRTGRGYCDDSRHPGSIWNVEQNILKRKLSLRLMPGTKATAPPSAPPEVASRPEPPHADTISTADKQARTCEINRFIDSFKCFSPSHFTPVWPYPPSPRSVSPSTSTSAKSTVSCRATTIWAMRSPSLTTNSSPERFTKRTITSPL